jgi:drug/metabolite transporter (DMT)-like permease
MAGLTVNVRINYTIVAGGARDTLEELGRNPHFKAYLALIAVCFFWGTTYLGIRIALESFPPFALVAIRFTISGAILMAVALIKGAVIPRGRELRAALISGVLILGVGNGALVFAELLVPSGLAGLIITISPFWMVGLEALLPGGARLHWPTICGMAIGLAGSALLAAPGGTGHTPGQNIPTGFLILQIGMACWALGSILQKRQVSRAHPIVTGAVHQLAAGLGALPFAILVPQHAIIWNLRGVAAILYLVMFGSIVGYSAYVYALDQLPVAVVSVYPYINSIVAVILGWRFYHEPFSSIEALAMAIIFAGVFVVKRHSLASTLAPSAPPAVQNTEVTMNEKKRLTT